MLKKLFITVFVIGLLILFKTAGTSDVEFATQTQIISNAQFWRQFAFGSVLMIIGRLGYIIANKAHQ